MLFNTKYGMVHNMPQTILLSCALALAFAALQRWLMRRVFFARTVFVRVLLLFLKLPLWALSFVGIALWWGRVPLAVFGLTAGTVYLAASLFVYLRSKRGE